MSKVKTHKGFKKRMKVTAKGKVKYRQSCGSHLMNSKGPKRRRRIGAPKVMFETVAKKVKTRL